MLFLNSLLYCKTSTQNINRSNLIFSYDILSLDTLNYKSITQDQFEFIIENKIKINNDYAKYEKRYLIDSNLNLLYTKYNSSNLDTLTPYRDKIEFLGRTIIIDSIFYGDDFSLKCFPRASALNKVYKFSFENREFICFYIQDITNPDSHLNTSVLLFDITNRNKINLVLNAFQASEDLKCFGDFNNNNKLDFVLWTYGNSFSDTLNFYELEPTINEFILDDSHYLVITEIENTYYVDLDRSKWFSNTLICK
jgi:hypothetical protein